MMSKKAAASAKLLTETELELMNIIWKLSEASVNEVLQELPADRKLAYTSVSTIMRILEQKNVLGSRKEGRGHIYHPLFSKHDYEIKTVRHVVEKVFDGTPIALVKQLLNASELTDDELKELKILLKAKG
jgi:predicted transcriptional regulator